MSAPATVAAPSSAAAGSADWADILEVETHRSRSMTAGFATTAAASRKRTLTNFSAHDPAFAEDGGVSPPSKASSTSRSGRSANMPATLSIAEYYTRCKKVAEARVEDMVLRHHKHRTVDSGRVDQMRWKLLKEKNYMTIYRRLGKPAPGQVPDVLATGAIPGALEDVLHGVVNLTTEAMQIENAYAERDMVDNRVLVTLVAPSVSEPFRSVTIKWVLRNHEDLSRHRDYVYLESTGITTAPDGEKIGYHLMHSVSLPSAPAFTKDTNIIRGQLSVCYIYRQQRQNSVEVFFNGNLNPQGNTRDRPALVIAVDAIVASPSSVQCAMMKKLALSLRTKPPVQLSLSQTRSRKTTITSFMRSTSVPHAERQLCAVCRRSLRFFGKGSCQLCASVTCSRCRVTKKLFMFDHGVFNPVKMEFCTECVVSTNTMNSSWAASRELELASQQDDVHSDTETLRSGSQRYQRRRKAHSIESEDSADEERYTMMSGDYNNGSGYDRSSRIWMPSDRVLRPTADILASIRSEPDDEDERSGHPAFFTEEEEDGDVVPIVEMPSDDEGDDFGPTNHAVDLVILYKP